MRRTLRSPKNAEVFSRLIAALRVFAGQRPPANQLEHSLNEALAIRRVNPNIAKRLVENLDRIPRRTRMSLIGESSLIGYVATKSTETPVVPPLHVVLPAWRWMEGRRAELLEAHPDAITTVAYKLRYQGFFCEEETRWDGASDSDEIYFVTSAISGDTNAVTTMRQPLGHEKYYGEVDTDEARIGPVATVWEGNSDVVSLVVTAFERDSGDPDAHRDEVDALVTATIALVPIFYPTAAVVALFQQTIVDAINWLLGTGDDPMSVETVVLPRGVLELHSGSSRGLYIANVRQPKIQNGQIVFQYVPVTTNLMYHFKTTHNGGGGKYVACFDVERTPPLPGGVIL